MFLLPTHSLQRAQCACLQRAPRRLAELQGSFPAEGSHNAGRKRGRKRVWERGTQHPNVATFAALWWSCDDDEPLVEEELQKSRNNRTVTVFTYRTGCAVGPLAQQRQKHYSLTVITQAAKPFVFKTELPELPKTSFLFILQGGPSTDAQTPHAAQQTAAAAAPPAPCRTSAAAPSRGHMAHLK